MRIDDLKPGDLLVGPSKTMTDAHFLFFSGLTGDNHPVHYDVEYARRTRFGRPVTHGLLLASMTALGALPGTHELEGFAFVEQGCRFLRPVFVGDTVQPRLEVAAILEDEGRRLIRFASALTNQRGETVLEGFHVYQMIGPRRSGGAE